METVFYPPDTLERKQYKYAVVLSRHGGGLLLSRNRNRAWEQQGGHIEAGETPLAAACRELYEESGAVEFTIAAAFDYGVADPSGETMKFGQVFIADIHRCGPLPELEISETRVFSALPADLSFPEITPALLKQAEALFPNWTASAQDALQIRPIDADDDPDVIGDIYAASWQSAYRGIVPQDYLDQLSGELWSPLIASKNLSTFLLLQGGRPIGTATVCAAREAGKSGWGEIVSIYLLPQHFGAHLGALLLRAAIDALRQQGFRQLFLWVLEENHRARRFYEAHGFLPSTDRSTQEIGGKPLGQLRYVLGGVSEGA